MKGRIEMISQERFNQIEITHGCGYWFECTERSCPCAIVTENKGLKQDIWDGFKKEQRELNKGFENDSFDCEPIAQCSKCKCLENISDLTDGLCLDCLMELEEEMEED